MFGATYSDHMLEIDWSEKGGWSAPLIRPLGPLSIDPGASCLHYGLECFEGMKAYRGGAGEILLFRPQMNMARFTTSMQRMALPVRRMNITEAAIVVAHRVCVHMHGLSGS